MSSSLLKLLFLQSVGSLVFPDCQPVYDIILACSWLYFFTLMPVKTIYVPVLFNFILWGTKDYCAISHWWYCNCFDTYDALCWVICLSFLHKTCFKNKECYILFLLFISHLVDNVLAKMLSDSEIALKLNYSELIFFVVVCLYVNFGSPILLTLTKFKLSLCRRLKRATKCLILKPRL